MTTDPCIPATAAVADLPTTAVSLQGGDNAAAPFFAVSLPKLAILSLCSLGFYEIYWFYKNWQLIGAREQSNISPALRACFAVLFCYSCFTRIRDHGTQLGVAPALAAGALATGWIVTTILWKLPDPYWLVTMLAFVFLLPAQAYVNRINKVSAPNHDPNARFSGWNWVMVILGGSLFILGIISTFTSAN